MQNTHFGKLKQKIAPQGNEIQFEELKETYSESNAKELKTADSKVSFLEGEFYQEEEKRYHYLFLNLALLRLNFDIDLSTCNINFSFRDLVCNVNKSTSSQSQSEETKGKKGR